MLQKKQLLFSGQEINCYIYKDNNQKYYGYEFILYSFALSGKLLMIKAF